MRLVEPLPMPRGTLKVSVFRGIALLLCIAGVACSGDDGVEHRITLEVQDGWIREPGSECAGSRPFLYVHREAPFEVQDANGDTVDSGRLPEGTAVEAANEDLEVPRVPTFCRFEFTLSLPEGDDYRLVLEEGDPLEFPDGSPPADVELILP